jgi:hypothetical protein
MSVDEQVSYPLKQKSGWYVLSDGRKVRGEERAREAEDLLLYEVTPVPEPRPAPDPVPSFVVGDPVPMPTYGSVVPPVPVAPLPKGTVFVDCRTHPSGNGTGLAAPHDLTTVVDHSFCPAPR